MILIDDTHALMSEETFRALPEYSLSIPTGVEVGKAWKRLNGGVLLYCWFAPANRPGYCYVEAREIIIVREGQN